jgi:hypothetical protein
MKRLAVLAFAVVGLTLALSAQAADEDHVIVVKPDTQLRFGGLRCVARTTTYSYLTCISLSGKYEVAVSRTSVIVTRARDGHVIYEAT